MEPDEFANAARAAVAFVVHERVHHLAVDKNAREAEGLILALVVRRGELLERNELRTSRKRFRLEQLAVLDAASRSGNESARPTAAVGNARTVRGEFTHWN